ncbi:aminotransferase class V-fold PLP-dependent enzyme (plasmid) [Legionella sp. D16C41]|uniref:aminotransferase class V-fold PLP-dependent enzyme n=1 Tax=Legionella sp. D16C41 TaxID=3402688 RepID=UPI003AF528D7
MKNFKALFYLPQNDIYMASHSTGCLPKKTKLAIEQFLFDWSHHGVEAWEQWLLELDKFNQSLATLFNADAREFCFQTNVSSALSKIIQALPKRLGRKKIIISEMDFLTVRFIAEQAKKLGYEIVILKSTDEQFTLSSWKEALTEQVQMAIITHVIPKNNFKNPVEEIIAVARQYDIISVVDIAQSAGIVPIDFKKMNADVIISNCLKWLCSGPGTAFLWVNQNFLDLFNPLDVGWFSNEAPFDFNSLEFHYASNSRRFLGGTPAILACLAARHSVDNINQIGMDTIHLHNQQHVDHILSFILKYKLNLKSPSDKNIRGGTVCLKFTDTLKAYQFLKQNHIITDSVKTVHENAYIRISPHIYNSVDEIEQVLNCLNKMRE